MRIGKRKLWYPKGTNYLTRSEQIDTWSLSQASVQANVVAAPNGIQTADRVTFLNGIYQLAYRRTNTTQLTTYTFGVWIKAASSGMYFRLSRTNTITWVGATVSPVYEATPVWRFFSLTYTTLAGETQSDNLIGYLNYVITPGDYDVWGGQLVVGTVAKPYHPTTSAAVSWSARYKKSRLGY
jgi:hypothetical protein